MLFEKMNDVMDKKKQPDDVWQSVLAFVNNEQGDVYLSLRMPLYVAISKKLKYTLKENVVQIIKCKQWLGMCSKDALQTFPVAPVMFYLPYDSPSNLNNILPVLQEIKKRCVPYCVIVNDMAVACLDAVIYKDTVVSVLAIIQTFGLKQRIGIFIKAVKVYLYIVKQYKKHQNGNYKYIFNNPGFFIYHIYYSLLAYKAFSCIFKQCTPKFAISTSDFWPSEHQFFRTANQHAVPTAVIQHGIIASFWWPFIAQYNFLWGDLFKKQLVRLGADETRLISVGMPASDELFNSTCMLDVEDDNKRNVCLIISQTHAQLFPIVAEKYKELLLLLIQEFPYIEWQIKLHPNENMQFYTNLNADVTVLPKTVTIKDALKTATFCCTIYSTAGLEAMIMNKPLVVFNLVGEIEEYAWWPKHGGGKYTQTIEETKLIIGDIIESFDYRAEYIKQQEKFLKSCFVNRGNAANKIVDKIAELIVP